MTLTVPRNYVLGVLKKYEKSNSQIVQRSLEEMARRPMHADLHSPAVVTTQAREPGHQYA